MAECNTCGGYLSIEDKIRLSMKCDANGNVVWQGALLNQNEPEVEAYIDGLTTPLSSGQISKINSFVKALKSGLSISALSDAFDFMQIWWNETSEAALKNIVKNAHHGTLVNNPVFNELNGFTGNGTDQYVNLNYNASTQAVSYLKDNCSIIVYSVEYNATNINKSDVGARVALNNQMAYIECNTDQKRINLNSNTDQNIGSADLVGEDKKGVGLNIYNRTGSNSVNLYINGNVYNKTVASSSIPNLGWYALAINVNGTPARHTTRTLALVAAGRSFSKAECDSIKAAFDSYISGL